MQATLPNVIFAGVVVGAVVYLAQQAAVKLHHNDTTLELSEQPLDPYDANPNPATESTNPYRMESDASKAPNPLAFQANVAMDIQYNESKGYDRVKENSKDGIYTEWNRSYDPVNRA